MLHSALGVSNARCFFLPRPAHALSFRAAKSFPSAQDFNSPKLKTKQHWNSFTTAFFIPLEQVLLDLEAKDAVAVDPVQAEALLKQPLRCHKCQAAMRNMPDLKSHIMACTVRAAPHRAASAL